MSEHSAGLLFSAPTCVLPVLSQGFLPSLLYLLHPQALVGTPPPCRHKDQVCSKHGLLACMHQGPDGNGVPASAYTRWPEALLAAWEMGLPLVTATLTPQRLVLGNWMCPSLQ